MEKIHGNMFFSVYMLKIYMKPQKHACFHVIVLPSMYPLAGVEIAH